MDQIVPLLPHVNATLNAIATLLLLAGYVLIKRGKQQAHKQTMLACFAVSVVFLACYLVYHANTQAVKKFPEYPATAIRYSYYFILLTHIVLAALVPLLAVATIYLGWKERFQTHRRLARWTFPIWLYVSLTGVLVYLMLYQFFPPR